MDITNAVFLLDTAVETNDLNKMIFLWLKISKGTSHYSKYQRLDNIRVWILANNIPVEIKVLKKSISNESSFFRYFCVFENEEDTVECVLRFGCGNKYRFPYDE